MADNSNDETSFPNKLLLTKTQVSRIRKAFANGSSANVKLSKNQLSKILQLGGIYQLYSWWCCRPFWNNVRDKGFSQKSVR